MTFVPPKPPKPDVPQRLLIGVSGSIASLALPTYLNVFRAMGVDRMTLVLTPAAEKFLPAATLALISDTVVTEADHGPGHVALARWADGILVLPATAHLLGCAAHGLGPNLLSTTLLAAEEPVVFVPAMNPVMWRGAAVRRNVRQLRADGHVVVEPVEGQAYEVATRTLRPGLTLPPPETLLAATRRVTEEAA
ncbi:flavoprotein [Streptomyces sp. NPDC048442]|uniref:flavoprotein n=1 Tax=Streptomyces sp. NPDC048442 TaxID=3154823 RepID=UPI00343613FC